MSILYSSNSSFRNYLYTCAVDSNKSPEILNSIDLYGYYLTKPRDVLDIFSPTEKADGFANYFVNQWNSNDQYNFLYSQVSDSTQRYITNNQADFINFIYTNNNELFGQLYTAIFNEDYNPDHDETNIQRLANEASNSDIIDFVITGYHQGAYYSDMVNLFMSSNDYLPNLRDWLGTRDSLDDIIQINFSNSVIYNTLQNTMYSPNLRTRMNSEFGANTILSWAKTNEANDFTKFASSALPSRPAIWQNANLPNPPQNYYNARQSNYVATPMENYFTNININYGQNAYDNIILAYDSVSTTYLDSFTLNEWVLYGSARLGVYSNKKTLAIIKFDANLNNGEFSESSISYIYLANPSYNLWFYEKGVRNYELSNHLGNVLAVISDKRIPICVADTLNHYIADVISMTDYSAFGAPLAGRSFNGGKYRYGFNGKEKDDEVVGAGNCIAYELRIYDPRLGRFNSIDPRQREYPWQSTYAYFKNSPISTVDFKGGGGPFDPKAGGEEDISGTPEALGTPVAPVTPEPEKKSVKDLALSPQGKAFIASWEQGPKGGPALSLYDDANPKATYKEGDPAVGFLTIGYGHKVLPGEDFSKGITQDQADALLSTDIQIKAINPILKNVTAEMTQQQFDALVSYVFNTGSLRKTQLLEKLNNGDYENAVNEMDINTSQGVFMQGLEN